MTIGEEDWYGKVLVCNERLKTEFEGPCFGYTFGYTRQRNLHLHSFLMTFKELVESNPLRSTKIRPLVNQGVFCFPFIIQAI